MPTLRSVLALIAGVTLGAEARADTPPAPASPVVHLPQFTVTDTPILPGRDLWRHAEVPGYEILAQTSDAGTAALAGDIAEFGRLIQKIYPAIKATRAEPTRLILCTRRVDFESFIPPAVRAGFPVDQVNRLFIGEEAHPIVVLYFSPRTSAGAYDVDLARAYVANRLRTHFPPLPAWYIEGISRVYGAAEIDYRRSQQVVLVGKLDDRPAPAVAVSDSSGVSSQDFSAGAPRIVSTEVARIVQGDILQAIVKLAVAAGASTATDPDLHVIGFRKYFTDNSKPAPPLASLFAGPSGTNYEDWSQGCGLFLHYCLFSTDRRSLFPAMEKFFKNLPTAPDADPAPAFQAAFGSPYREVESDLAYYLIQSDYRATKYQFPDDRPSPPELRDASDAEVSDIKAQAYGAAGYPGKGAEELIATYLREKAKGKFEPRLLAALGLWEASYGQASRAVPLVAAAAAARYPDPELYVALARQRLVAIGSARPLTAAETQACLEPLATARSIGAPDSAVYRLAAEVLARASTRPSPEDLAILAEGAKAFPADPTLNYAVAIAYLHAGQDADARLLIQRQLAYGDAATRSWFEKLSKTEASGR